MKRQTVSIETVLSWPNLMHATYQAAKGKRHRSEVQAFMRDLPEQFRILRHQVLDEPGPLGEYKTFTIRDPKTRCIHAAYFPYRVLHHALINQCGASLDKALVDNTFACRKNKGVHKAVNYVQKQLQRYPYFVQIDIDGYFKHICHQTLLALLNKRFKGEAFLKVCERILDSFHHTPQIGLPIGSLCSQYWANEYLNSFDRTMQEVAGCSAYCRYMDDILWWYPSRLQAQQSLSAAQTYLAGQLKLSVKAGAKVHDSANGVNYCGYEIRRGVIHPSRRKRQSYQYRLLLADAAFEEGELSEQAYQNACVAAHSILLHTESSEWCQYVLKKMWSR